MEDLFDVNYLLGALRRRWILIVSTIVLTAPLALLVAYVLPPVYQSSGRILIESQLIPTDLAASTVMASPDERIAQIQQRLTTRDNLLELARRYNLYADFPDLSPSDLVDRMRAATTIESISFSNAPTWARDRRVDAVQIAFRASDPVRATQVANEFITQLLAQNTRQRTASASETTQFFDAQVQRLSDELDAIQQRITAFKSANAAALPESLAFRQQTLAALERQEFDRDSRRLALSERRRGLEEAIAIGRADTSPALTPEEQEIRRLRSELAQQGAIYAPSHPAVRSLNARIAALEEALPEETASDAAPAGGRAADALRQIEQIETELELLDQQSQADEDRRTALEESILRTPEVEAQLSTLERQRGSIQAQYEEAVSKRAAAATGERLEVNNQAERFEVIEQPQRPEEPVSPNRVLIAGAGGVLSVGLAFGLALLVELLNPALHTGRDMERRLQLRPIVSVPYITTTGEAARRRWTLRVTVVLVLSLVVGAVFAADQLVMPLPLLAERLAEKSGLTEMMALFGQRFGG